MTILRSLITAFGMFSKLPIPSIKWQDSNMRYMLAMFPFVGVIVGLVIWAWLWVCEALGFGVILRAAGLTLVPIAITGGIHLDGFCDTIDALSSRASPERKREILKDPHVGAFALIGVAAYLIAYFAVASELQLDNGTPLMLGLLLVLSRTLSGLSVLMFSSNAAKGLLSTFKASAGKKASLAILIAFLALCAVFLCYLDILTGCAVLAVALICFGYLFVMSRRQFGGMSGDLAGYFLQICELSMLAVIVLVQKVVSL